MTDKTIPLFKVYHDLHMEEMALEVLRSGSIATGVYVDQFRGALRTLVNGVDIVTTNDMSNAIQIAFRLAGVGEGAEVLTTAFACMSTNAPIATSGAKPVWVDIDPLTGSMDPDALRRSITSRCKALILYHVAGYPANVAEISRICDENNIVLIEDCDNALLATVDGRMVGTWGQYAIYSFYPNRQINATEGGAVVCADPQDAVRGIKLRRYGIDLKAFRLPNGEIDPEYDIPEIGWAANLNNLCSAIGLSQVSTVLDRVNQARRNADFLDKSVSCMSNIQPVAKLAGAEPSYWVYLIRTSKRDELMNYLKEKGVGCSKLHLLNTRYSGFGVTPPNLPRSREFMETVLAIPCGWWLNGGDLNYMTQLLLDFDRLNTCH